MNILDRTISAISPSWALKRQMLRRAMLSSAYKGASQSRLRNNWTVFGSDESTPADTELALLRDRSREANRNDPIASGATETLKINIVGQGLKPQSRLRPEVLGISPEQAREIQKQIESIWQSWMPYADSANRMDFAEMQLLAITKIIEDGEVLALPVWANEPWRPLSRSIEMIEAHRLGTPTDRFNDVQAGIRLGRRGQPLTYYIRRSTDGKQNILDLKFTPISAFDSSGRPKVLHVFPTKRPGQLRGVPWFAPVLTYFKDLADYLEAEIVAARVAACLAVFVTKQDPMTSAIAMGADSETDSGARIQSIEPGLVSYLNTGEGINVVDPKRPGDSFPSYVETMLRLIGVSLGLPYELILKDFSKTNYSSARASLLEARRMFTNWRGWFARRFCQPVFDLVIEEAYLRGMLDAPDFYNFKTEYCRAAWIGGGWGWVDPVKEVQSSQMAIDAGLTTLAEEAAGQGRDWEEVLEQRAREQLKIKELGIQSAAESDKKESAEDEQEEDKDQPEPEEDENEDTE